jgi:hypothetical protein
MQRVRVTVQHNPEDPADDLRRAARVRRDLWAHSPVEIDPDSPFHGTRRDVDRNAYFEFATDRLPEVQRVLREFGHIDRASIEVVAEAAGVECVNCGHLAPELTTICPSCSFRDVAPCPACQTEVPRLAYVPIAGDLFQCPSCQHRVRLAFADPLFDQNGQYHQPLVHVTLAEAPEHNGV